MEAATRRMLGTGRRVTERPISGQSSIVAVSRRVMDSTHDDCTQLRAVLDHYEADPRRVV